jgi:hypothetical protein
MQALSRSSLKQARGKNSRVTFLQDTPKTEHRLIFMIDTKLRETCMKRLHFAATLLGSD